MSWEYGDTSQAPDKLKIATGNDAETHMLKERVKSWLLSPGQFQNNSMPFDSIALYSGTSNLHRLLLYRLLQLFLYETVQVTGFEQDFQSTGKISKFIAWGDIWKLRVFVIKKNDVNQVSKTKE